MHTPTIVETFDPVDEILSNEHAREPDTQTTLDRAAASGKPALVNVIIRQDRNYKGGIYV